MDVHMLSLITLLASFQSAHAGGVGLFGQAGMHQGFAPYYDVYDIQELDSQMLAHYGFGFEGILGDKDDRLKGIFRISWNQDQPLSDPDMPVGDYYFPEESTKGTRDDGLISIGLQWGIWGEPTQFEIIATTLLTSGFWTADSLEYFVVDVGAGATYSVQENIQLFGIASFSPRYRKQLYFAGQATLGARFLFD